MSGHWATTPWLPRACPGQRSQHTVTCSRNTGSQGQGHSPSWTRRPSQVPSNLSDSVILSCDPQSPGDAQGPRTPLAAPGTPGSPTKTPLPRADARMPLGESCWPVARAGPSQREVTSPGTRGLSALTDCHTPAPQHRYLPPQQRHPRGLGEQRGARTGLLKPRPSPVLSSAVLQLQTGEEEERSLKGGSAEGCKGSGEAAA